MAQIAIFCRKDAQFKTEFGVEIPYPGNGNMGANLNAIFQSVSMKDSMWRFTIGTEVVELTRPYKLSKWAQIKEISFYPASYLWNVDFALFFSIDISRALHLITYFVYALGLSYTNGTAKTIDDADRGISDILKHEDKRQM